VENDVWIGPGVRILGEVTVGSNSIIGANAVVTRDVAENSVVGGVPAKLIRTIKPGSLDVAGGRLLDE
jgi:acetyltransferase-like isoleucine patch superfamily enzyme